MTSTDRLPAPSDTRAALDAAAARRAADIALFTPYTPATPADRSRNMQRTARRTPARRIIR